MSTSSNDRRLGVLIILLLPEIQNNSSRFELHIGHLPLYTLNNSQLALFHLFFFLHILFLVFKKIALDIHA